MIKLFDLQVEVESLKKEIQEKHDLLCQAVKAMELEEDEYKKIGEEKEKEINDLREQLESLQQKYQVSAPPKGYYSNTSLYCWLPVKNKIDLREITFHILLNEKETPETVDVYFRSSTSYQIT